MNEQRSQALIWLISINVYVLIALAVTLFVEGGAREFCLALATLCGARVVFYAIETAGEFLARRLYGGKSPPGRDDA